MKTHHVAVETPTRVNRSRSKQDCPEDGPGCPTQPPAGAGKQDLVDSFEKLAKYEGNIDVAKASLQIVRGNLYNEETVAQATDEFIKLQNSLGGPDATQEAQELFTFTRKTVGQHGCCDAERPDKEAAIRSLYLAEARELGDTVGDFNIVASNKLPSETYSQATEKFVGVLNRLGGNLFSEKARDMYVEEQNLVK
ncbi:MAG: hypothetical protein HYU64_02115 [Armatimonadetes bacterium]|nr:hypothetical protein [Armatimonadota bacterium]